MAELASSAARTFTAKRLPMLFSGWAEAMGGRGSAPDLKLTTFRALAKAPKQGGAGGQPRLPEFPARFTELGLARGHRARSRPPWRVSHTSGPLVSSALSLRSSMRT